MACRCGSGQHVEQVNLPQLEICHVTLMFCLECFPLCQDFANFTFVAMESVTSMRLVRFLPPRPIWNIFGLVFVANRLLCTSSSLPGRTEAAGAISTFKTILNAIRYHCKLKQVELQHLADTDSNLFEEAREAVPIVSTAPIQSFRRCPPRPCLEIY